ncbi:MAG TPA: hypothetical protein VGB74_03410 [Actinoplanes sp.]|jgi:hypothetical protein
MGLTWAEIAQALVGGLAGVLGVYAVQDVLTRLRETGRCPERWRQHR